MKHKILFVDDHPELPQSFKRQLRHDFDIDIASSGQVGLDKMHEKGPYTAVVSDMQMPEMDGVRFLQEYQKHAPDTVRIMLTGNIDQETAVQAVNSGKIFRFLNKPCAVEDMAAALADAVRQYQLITAEKDLLEKTLSGSVKLLTDILSMIDPDSFGNALGLREPIRKVAIALGLKNPWDIELAAMVSNIGAVVLPKELVSQLGKGSLSSEDEEELKNKINKCGSKLLLNIPRLDKVANYVLHLNDHYSKSKDTKDDAVPLASRIIKVVKDWKMLENAGLSPSAAYDQLKKKASCYDPRVLDELEKIIHPSDKVPAQEEAQTFEISVPQLCVGQLLLADVRAKNGVLLIAAGSLLSEANIERIKSYSEFTGIVEPIKVNCLIPTTDLT